MPNLNDILKRSDSAAYKISPEIRNKVLAYYKYNQKIDNLKKLPVDGVPFPSHINFEITILCNLRCKFCWWWGENGIAYKLIEKKDPLITALSTEEVLRVLKEIALHKSDVYFSGGEPLIRPDFKQILKFTYSEGIPVSFTTNGTLIDEDMAKELSQMKNLTIIFSIDGPEEIHDNIRGKGNFKKTVDAISNIKKFRGKSKFPIIQTNTTITPGILGKFEKLIEFISSLGVDQINFEHLWYTDKEHVELNNKILYNEFGIVDDLGAQSHISDTFSHDQLESLANEIVYLEKKRFKVLVNFGPILYKEEVIKYYTDLRFTKLKYCDVPWNKVTIKASGDIMFCPDEWITKFKMGNIKDSTIENAWNSDNAKKFRAAIKKYSFFPICARCCFVNK